MSNPIFITIDEAASRRGCHPGTLAKLARRGVLTRYRDRADKRRTLYDPAEIEALSKHIPHSAA